jgi:hypothetical protein
LGGLEQTVPPSKPFFPLFGGLCGPNSGKKKVFGAALPPQTPPSESPINKKFSQMCFNTFAVAASNSFDAFFDAFDERKEQIE